MKSFILLAFAITIAVALEHNPENDKCEAASVFYIECNQCRCANDGNGAICTRKRCIPGDYDDHGVLINPAHDISKRSAGINTLIILDEEPEFCEYGKRYKIDCNECSCSRTGKLACTRKMCIHEPNERPIRMDYPDLPEGDCEFGTIYKKDCNTCFCGKLGLTACTLKQCEVDVVYHTRKTRSGQENWGPRYNQGDVCEPGKKFFSECNECFCNADSVSAVCTLMMCPPHNVE